MSTITATATQVDQAVDTDVLVIPDAILANARELDDVRTAIKVMKEREETLRASVLDFLETSGDDAAAQDGVAISLSRSVRTGVDTKRLEALYPRVYADTKTTTPVTQVRVKVKG